MNLIVLPVTDSTNNFLQRRLSAGEAMDGDIVLALEQTSGRGQRGNSWESKAGEGLYASLLMYPPSLSVEKQFGLNKAVSVAVAMYLEELLGKEVALKWPNDLLVQERKIAGILLEGQIRGQQVSSIIAGVGINLNQDFFTGDFHTAPVSAYQVTGIKYDPVQEVERLAEKVLRICSQWWTTYSPDVENAYSARLFRKGLSADFSEGVDRFEAVLLDVDGQGGAVIDIDGQVRTVYHPQVRMEMGRI
jgi:BirA family biotin operon repressor/biotin-[acetyl-CoA-carboxylase] ligase